MADPTDYNSYQTAPGNAPPWLLRDFGKAFLQSFGFVKDSLLLSAKRAVQARFPLVAPSDALGPLGVERDLEPMAVEPEASYRQRLVTWAWGHAQANAQDATSQSGNVWRGTQKGVMDAVTLAAKSLGCTGPFLFRSALGNPTWANSTMSPAIYDAHGHLVNWARYWIILGGTTWGFRAWDDFGLRWDRADLTWDSTAQPEAVQLILRQVRAWNSPVARCEAVLVSLDGADPTLWTSPDDALPHAAFWIP